MQALLVRYLEKLDSNLSLSDYEQLLKKAKTILPSDLFKKLKKCFEYESGWLFTGLDFDSLEDKISAVTTKDPEKIKVYSDGYDGHCLRALAYFAKEMKDIELAPENSKTYKVTIDSKDVYFHSQETIIYEGITYTGEEFFNKIS